MAHSDAAVMLLTGMPAGAPEAIDARAARLSFTPTTDPVCCARGAPIDARDKLALQRLWPELMWSPEGPEIDGIAPSGVVHRLASAPHCSALVNVAGGVRGDGCGIRARDARLLLDGCALFPLDVIGSVLTPSPRIDPTMLQEADAAGPSLWDEARAWFALRFGEAAADIVDAAATQLRARRSRGLHLKTIR